MSILANEILAGHDADVDIIAYGPDREVFYPLHEDVRVLQPEFDFHGAPRILSTLRTLAFVRKTVKAGRYDALLSFGERWNSFVMLACAGLGQRIILSDQSSPQVDLGWVQSRLRHLLYPRAYGLIAQTSQYRDMALKKKFHTNIEVIPNPVLERPRVQEEDRKNVILSVGRLISTKHHDRLISNFAALGADDWELVIVGDDSQRQEHRGRLEKLAGQLGVAERVHLVGAQSNVQRYYGSARVFAFTSSSEGLPNVVAEALAAGLPVVSYDCVAGPSDLVRHDYSGYLVDVFDDEQFCQHLQVLLTDNDKRISMSANARESMAGFLPDKIATRFYRFMVGDA